MEVARSGKGKGIRARDHARDHARGRSVSCVCCLQVWEIWIRDKRLHASLRWKCNAPINGLPQDGGAGQPTGIRLRKANVGGDFDIYKGMISTILTSTMGI